MEFNLNEFLAKEVMKWKTDEETGRWITENGLLGKTYWYPSNDISDAWGLLEQFEEGLVRKRLNGLNYRAWVKHEGKEYSEIGYSPSDAIVNVVLRAYGLNEHINK